MSIGLSVSPFSFGFPSVRPPSTCSHLFINFVLLATIQHVPHSYLVPLLTLPWTWDYWLWPRDNICTWRRILNWCVRSAHAITTLSVKLFHLTDSHLARLYHKSGPDCPWSDYDNCKYRVRRLSHFQIVCLSSERYFHRVILSQVFHHTYTTPMNICIVSYYPKSSHNTLQFNLNSNPLGSQIWAT